MVYENHSQRRKKLEGKRTRQLDIIYRRDHAICQICLKYVAREDASRDHILRLVSCTKEEARNLDNMRLTHKLCNESRDDYEDVVVVPLVVRNKNGKPRLTTKLGFLYPELQDMFRGSDE